MTSLGLVQMTRKRVGQGLVEAFSTTCDHCDGRGYLIHTHPVEHSGTNDGDKKHAQVGADRAQVVSVKEDEKTKAAMKSIAAAAKAEHDEGEEPSEANAEPKDANVEAGEANTAAPKKKVRQRRSASSGGTIVPSNSQGAILSFPTEK